MRLSLINILAAAQTSLAAALPQTFTTDSDATSTSSGYWLADIKRQGAVAYGNPAYKVFRNVKDYGAKGDGTSDDTAAISAAITDGNRCGQGCDSSTLTPAIVYFPPGTYMISTPIVQLYYTQFVGHATDRPVLKATAGFTGMAVIDSDPYGSGGDNWFTNQNNFFRQVRNFVIDLTGMPATSGTGIHWQVAQATSLQNILFKMQPASPENKQLGIFMDNGSGGFMTDLEFHGGNYGAFLGSQQYTTRNLKFSGQNTAIYMNWNWVWTFKSVSIENCQIGLDMAGGGPAVTGGVVNQSVGSVLMLDSKITNTPVGFKTAFSMTGNTPTTGGTLILDNVDFGGCDTAVQDHTGASVLAGGSVVESWTQGKSYSGSNAGSSIRNTMTPPTKPQALMKDGKFFERSKPQYGEVACSSFVSIKDQGAKGDGVTDDTAAIQKAMDSLQSHQILYFDHGAYIVTDTIKVPKTIKMTGEIWPLIMASGAKFADQSKPTPVFQVGQAGDTGAVEMSDMIFGIAGSAPGAVMIEWNVNGEPGKNGMWDVHVRIGGYSGSQLQSDKCSKSPSGDHSIVNPACMAANTLFHATPSSSVYLENTWFWVADHELDLADHNQIDIYNGRGVLIESHNGAWLYGTASEHNVLYNYQLSGAKNVFMGVIQTETAYYQGNPTATTPFKMSGNDPTFTDCNGDASCEKTWGLRILDSSDTLVYGAGLYSFFDNYGQDCVGSNTCQKHILDVQRSTQNLYLFGLSTKASVNMVSSASLLSVGETTNSALDASMLSSAVSYATEMSLVKDAENRSNFCATLALWTPGSGSTL